MDIYNYLIINRSLSIFMISNNDNRHNWIWKAIHWKFHKWTKSLSCYWYKQTKIIFSEQKKVNCTEILKFRQIILQCRGNEIANKSSHAFKLSAKEWTFEHATERNRNKQNRKKIPRIQNKKNDNLAWYCKSWNWFQRNLQKDKELEIRERIGAILTIALARYDCYWNYITVNDQFDSTIYYPDYSTASDYYKVVIIELALPC